MEAVGGTDALAARVGRIATESHPRQAELREREPRRMDRDDADPIEWIVLVARDQPDLHAHLCRAFSRDQKVEIVMDRRRSPRRNPPWLEDRLRIHGAAVVRKAARS